MEQLERDLQQSINVAQHLGVYCFVGMVTGEVLNVPAHARNTILYNNEIVEKFLHEKCNLEELQGHFYSHVLTCQGHGDVVLKEKREHLAMKKTADLSTCNNAVRAVQQWSSA